MSNLDRILKRRRAAAEAELDDLRLVVLARLDAANGDTAEEPPASDLRPIVVRRANGETPGGAIAHPDVGAETQSPSNWLLVAPLEDQPAGGAASVEPPEPDQPTAPIDDEPRAVIALGALVTAADPPLEDGDGADVTVAPQSRQRRRPGRAAAKERRRRTGARTGAMPVTSADPLEPTPVCPYCAVRLPQPPETDDRCPRCGQRMIVRSVGARVAILAEAVLPFFEAERLNEERWARDRDRWLELAHGSGVGGDRAPNLAGELISEADVAAARAWYMSSADRAFRIAATERRWDEAARIRYEQAGVLSRIAGSSVAPSDELVRLHRDGVAADLEAIGEVARDAEVRGESCCEACRVDDRRVVQVGDELRSPTLPHEGCPNGLCLCRWYLTTRDEELLAALLRRQTGADRRAAARPGEPQRDDAMSVSA